MSGDAGTNGDGAEDWVRPTVSQRDPATAAPQLEAWLTDRLGPASEPVVTDLHRPETNGMSSETLLFDVAWQEGGTRHTRSCVARIEPEATAVPVFPTYDLDKQFDAMRLVGSRTEVPVPETLWFEADPAVLGNPFFVMARVDGVVPPDVMPYTFGDCWLSDASLDDQAKVQGGAIGVLAGVHTLTPDNADLGFLASQRPEPTALGRHVGEWEDYYAWVAGDRPSPLLDRCFAWLHEHWPSTEPDPVLSWGDARIGNILWADFAPVAVLDWEMAGIAPPEVDLGWMVYLHHFFQDLTETMGLPGMPEFLKLADATAAYEARTGHRPADIEWYVAYAAIRHGVIMRRVTERGIAFGETEPPDDLDDLILHRATLEQMLAGTYWSTI